MYEIELKAWLRDREAAEAKLRSFAQYKGYSQKDDRYYSRVQDGAPSPLRIRIREETGKPAAAAYKKKETLAGETELNDEQEFTVSNPQALERFLTDAGFAVTARKRKSTDAWTYATPYGNAAIELSRLDRLGDFIEIEILSPSNEAALTAQIRATLYEILDLCAIPRSDIEPRYYVDLLKDLDGV